MDKATVDILDALVADNPSLSVCKEQISAAYDTIYVAYKSGCKLLLCGNGGSAADCEHIAGELMKGFLKRRKLPDSKASLFSRFGQEGEYLAENLQSALPCISLVNHMALGSAFGNDVDFNLTFAQLVMAYGNENDVLLALSTSGNALNVRYAAIAAKAIGMKVVCMTGLTGGELLSLCDVCICVPDERTFKIQEYHLPVYHALCAMLEEAFF